MQFANKEHWDVVVTANTDSGYGEAVLRYVERWVALMETAIDAGAQLADVVKQLSHDADTEGITGFQYGCAVSILSQCWLHGEELRRWHNCDCQIKDEGDKANESGGTLNPALLCIGDQSGGSDARAPGAVGTERN